MKEIKKEIDINKTKIDWPDLDYTWNPVTGCKRGCEYCYASKIHQRFNKTLFDEIVYHPERLNEPAKVKKPATIFVGSMSDIAFWDKEILEVVVKACEVLNRHTFMFLSKNYSPYERLYFPNNTIQGLTIEYPNTDVSEISIYNMTAHEHPYLSIEPISGGLDYDIPEEIELVIVGAMTGCGKNNIIPKREWVDSIIQHVPKEKIWWKESMRDYFPDLNNDAYRKA